MALCGVALAGLLTVLCVSSCLANGHYQSPSERNPPGHRDRCDDCMERVNDLAVVLAGVLAGFFEVMKQVRTKVTIDIPNQLDRQLLDIEVIKLALLSIQKGNETGELEKLADTVNLILDLERLGLREQQNQSAAIGDLSTQLKSQSQELNSLKESLRNITGLEQVLSKELLVHDEHLREHVHTGKNQEQRINDIHNAVFSPRDCGDIFTSGQNTSGLYRVLMDRDSGYKEIQVFCDFFTPGGGWLVFQRRQNGTVGFERMWKEYATGFGNPSGEFWIGNDVLHHLTSQRKYKLRIDMEDFDGQRRYAEYSQFSVGSAASSYNLDVGGYSGDAGDSLEYQNGMKFSTIDADNDAKPDQHCAQLYHGAWWYRDCHKSNLNGLYLGGPHKSFADGIEWHTWHGYYYSLKWTEMKILPIE